MPDGGLAAIWLAGWDNENHGWMGFAVAMSGPYGDIKYWDRDDRGYIGGVIARYFRTRVVKNWFEYAW